MKISIESLGALKSGEFDLDNDLIIITGPNNTGKSYLTYLLYGVLKLRSLLTYEEFTEELFFLISNQVRDKVETNNKPITISPTDVIESLFPQLIEMINRWIKRFGPEIFSSKSVNLKSNIILDFYSDLPEEVRKHPENSDIEIYRDLSIRLPNLGNSTISFPNNLANRSLDEVTAYVSGVVIRSFFRIFIESPVWFFPAERTAINMLAREIYKSKSADRDQFAFKSLTNEREELEKLIQERFIPRYPLAINDYIKFVNDLDQVVKNDSPYADIASEIENSLLGGKMALSQVGDMRFHPTHLETALELHVSSSLVKSLSGLVFYFRHIAKQGDVIIIDEPELNLHPDSQVALTRILAKAVNRGIKIVLSTHSDYIIKEFNNLIMLGKDAPEEVKGPLLETLGYDSTSTLKPEQIGAYFCADQALIRQEVSETGIEVPTIDQTIDQLDHNMESIYFSLFEKDEEPA